MLYVVLYYKILHITNYLHFLGGCGCLVRAALGPSLPYQRARRFPARGGPSVRGVAKRPCSPFHAQSAPRHRAQRAQRVGMSQGARFFFFLVGGGWHQLTLLAGCSWPNRPASPPHTDTWKSGIGPARALQPFRLVVVVVVLLRKQHKARPPQGGQAKGVALRARSPPTPSPEPLRPVARSAVDKPMPRGRRAQPDGCTLTDHRSSTA